MYILLHFLRAPTDWNLQRYIQYGFYHVPPKTGKVTLSGRRKEAIEAYLTRGRLLMVLIEFLRMSVSQYIMLKMNDDRPSGDYDYYVTFTFVLVYFQLSLVQWHALFFPGG